MRQKHVICASYGNDSIALIQWANEQKLSNVTVLYNDTGWYRDDWIVRVDAMEQWAKSLGFHTARTISIGFEALAKKRKAFPRQGMQFCTSVLKIEPTQRWLDDVDPEKRAIVMVGVRREESSNRATFPIFSHNEPGSGGRTRWAPLAEFTTEQRDALLHRAGIEPLPHRSMECFPCVNSNRSDIKMLADDPSRIEKIERLELEMGITSKGKPRTLFRPTRHMGATGIREVVRWAMSDRGKFDLSDGTGKDCDSGFCGM